MDNRNGMKRKRYNSSTVLLAVLIAFCILAIIEIIHGQTQVRAEREKRELLEEQNLQLEQRLQEVQGNTGDLQDDPDTAESTDQVDNNGEEMSGDSISANSLSEQNLPDNAILSDQDDEMQIVFMGDSVLADVSENGGVAARVAQACNASVYNMAIGGTTAGLLPEESAEYEKWQSVGFLGAVYAACGFIDSDVFTGYPTKEVIENCDFSRTDYFVVEYGINDFLCRQIGRSRYMDNGEVLNIDEPHTYVGALDLGVRMLIDHFPDAKILLISPHYCEIFENGTYIGNSYSLDYGCGTLANFGGLTGYVAAEHKNEGVLFLDSLKQTGIDAYNVTEYLKDGIHLSGKGCDVYADCISKILLSDYYREE